MEQVLSTFVRSIFVDNMIFAYYLGMCSFVAVSKNVKTALGLGMDDSQHPTDTRA